MRASKACQTNRKRCAGRVARSSATVDSPYAAARIATVDASDTSVVWSKRSAGRLSRKDESGWGVGGCCVEDDMFMKAGICCFFFPSSLLNSLALIKARP